MSLAQFREEIDNLDKSIIKLVNDRAKVSLKILQEKQKLNLQIYDPQREEQVLQKVMQENNGPLSADQIKSIFKIIIESCRNVQNQQKGIEPW
ncbi:MAG TPA: chorismate mutase [bacterium]